jgi:hypothetical protein
MKPTLSSTCPEYVVRLQVSDGISTGAPDRVTVSTRVAGTYVARADRE